MTGLIMSPERLRMEKQVLDTDEDDVVLENTRKKTITRIKENEVSPKHSWEKMFHYNDCPVVQKTPAFLAYGDGKYKPVYIIRETKLSVKKTCLGDQLKSKNNKRISKEEQNIDLRLVKAQSHPDPHGEDSVKSQFTQNEKNTSKHQILICELKKPKMLFAVEQEVSLAQSIKEHYILPPLDMDQGIKENKVLNELKTSDNLYPDECTVCQSRKNNDSDKLQKYGEACMPYMFPFIPCVCYQPSCPPANSSSPLCPPSPSSAPLNTLSLKPSCPPCPQLQLSDKDNNGTRKQPASDSDELTNQDFTKEAYNLESICAEYIKKKNQEIEIKEMEKEKIPGKDKATQTKKKGGFWKGCCSRKK